MSYTRELDRALWWLQVGLVLLAIGSALQVIAFIGKLLAG